MFITKTDQLQSDQVSCYNIANFMCNKLIKALKNSLVLMLYINPKYRIATNKLQNVHNSS